LVRIKNDNCGVDGNLPIGEFVWKESIFVIHTFTATVRTDMTVVSWFQASSQLNCTHVICFAHHDQTKKHVWVSSRITSKVFDGIKNGVIILISEWNN
jgi:hypothetical protein